MKTPRFRRNVNEPLLARVSNTVHQVSSLTGLDSTKQENMLLFVSSKTTESKTVKLETSHMEILPI